MLYQFMMIDAYIKTKMRPSGHKRQTNFLGFNVSEDVSEFFTCL